MSQSSNTTQAWSLSLKREDEARWGELRAEYAKISEAFYPLQDRRREIEQELHDIEANGRWIRAE